MKSRVIKILLLKALFMKICAINLWLQVIVQYLSHTLSLKIGDINFQELKSIIRNILL